MTLAEIIAKDPIRNPIWSEINGSMVAEISTLKGNKRETDPWERDLNRPEIKMSPVRSNDEDREIQCWEGTTSVRGQVVRLTIFND